jgi:ribonucleoside-diphosphate reductase alpha chain
MNSVVKIETQDVTSIPFQDASLDIWDKKYRLVSKTGQPIDKSMDDTYKRVARALADVEKEDVREHWYERFLWTMRHGAIPAGRVTSNAGAQEHKPATSTINCTVSGTIRDSMDDILGKVHEAGLTLKAGCGIGYEFSTLRPRGAYVSGAGAYTSGPLSFMDIYDKMCFTVSSAGGRRGAQMGTFDIGHPDVLEFIRAKRENGRLRQFNLSLLITDEFMHAVRADTDWQLAFPVTQKEFDAETMNVDDPSQFTWREWPITEGYVTNGEGLVACKIYKTIKARRVWDVIMSSTYDFAEPGFILIDRVNEMNNNWWCENIRATNPCGEQPLPPYGSCLLGSVNLTRFVRHAFTEFAEFDWAEYREVVKVFTRMLDNVVEVNGLPLSSSATKSCASAATAWASSASAAR